MGASEIIGKVKDERPYLKDIQPDIDEMLSRDAGQLDGDPHDKDSLNMRAIFTLADDIVLNHFNDDFHDVAVEALKKLP